MPGDLLAVKLEVLGGDQSGPPQASFEVGKSAEGEHERDYEHASINVDIQGTNPTRRSVNMEKPSRAMLLDRELEVFSSDKVYEEALAMAGIFIRGTARKEAEGPRKLSTGEPVSAGATRPTISPKSKGQSMPSSEAKGPKSGQGA